MYTSPVIPEVAELCAQWGDSLANRPDSELGDDGYLVRDEHTDREYEAYCLPIQSAGDARSAMHALLQYEMTHAQTHAMVETVCRCGDWMDCDFLLRNARGLNDQYRQAIEDRRASLEQ